MFARYLGLLGVTRRASSLGAMTELAAAHLTRIPFENVSKLYHGRRQAPPRRPPDLVRYLDGIERHHLGGTCYANAFNLHLLLAHLGYDVSLCGADMSAPDVHLVNVVRVEGRPYLVDVGYGAPFLEPLPLAQVPHFQKAGRVLSMTWAGSGPKVGTTFGYTGGVF